MHAATVHIVPVLAAEKSKLAFYLAGGALVVWALLVSLGMGLRVSGFPGSATAQRAVMLVTALLVAAALSTAVATSGGSTREARAAARSMPAAATGALAQEADPSGRLRFAKATLASKAGRLSIDFVNRSPLSHNLTVARDGTALGATPTFDGGSRTLTLSLKPGIYKFFCSVPGHREAGMEGTLVVS